MQLSYEEQWIHVVKLLVRTYIRLTRLNKIGVTVIESGII